MPERFPPIAALRALEAAARHLSFTKAADELHVTQSAISHQIKALETLWDLKLFERHSRRLALTRNGQALAAVAREFSESLFDTLDTLRLQSSRTPLRVDMLQSFAEKWLVPRLGNFHDQHPEIDVWISIHNRLVDFAKDSVDLAIRLGSGDYHGLHSTLLMREDVFPVCTREFQSREGTPKTPREMLDFPLLLRLGEPNHPNWAHWFAAAGVPGVVPIEGSRFPSTSMALQAAMSGQGIALARTAHVADDLAAGRLIRLFNVNCPSNVAYYLVCPEGQQTRPSTAAFIVWILAQAEAMKERLGLRVVGI